MQSGRFKGKVTITNKKGSLGVRFRVQTIDGESRQIDKGLGLNSSRPGDSEKARAIAEWIERDLQAGCVDPTMAKYLGRTQLVAITGAKKSQIPKPIDIFREYVKFKEKKPDTSPATLGYYDYLDRVISKIPADTESANDVYAWLIENNSLDTAKRVLKFIRTSHNHALATGRVTENPYTAIANPKVPKNSESEHKDPFSAEERDRIITAFADNEFVKTASRYSHSYYLPFIKFLFFTGCRPSEAIALNWEHVSDKYVTFGAAIVRGRKSAYFHKEGLKTQKNRRFPINEQLREILDEAGKIRANPKPGDPIFTSATGSRISWGNFYNRAWNPVLQGLESEGINYRNPYQMRHTFITLALEAGLDAKDVARLVGNSPEVIYRHYAGNKRDLNVPEL
jgi:integrase